MENMKYIRLLSFIACICGVSFFSLQAKAEDDLVAKFEQLISASQDKTNSVREVLWNPLIKKWIKRKYTATNIKYDVKRSDSLVRPVVAYVSFWMTSHGTNGYSTKQEAEKSNDFDKKYFGYDVTLNYYWKDNSWFFF
jgi:hypothetical protein